MAPCRRPHVSIFPTRLEQDAALLAAIRRRRRKAASHGCQTPLLDIGFDKDKAGLSEVYMHDARAVCADRGEEVGCLEAVSDVFQLLAVARKENSSSPWPVSNTYHVALNNAGSVRSRSKGLIKSPVAR